MRLYKESSIFTYLKFHLFFIIEFLILIKHYNETFVDNS